MDKKMPSPEHLLDIIPCGLLSFEANGPVRYFNQAFQNFTGYPATEIIGQKIEQFLTQGFDNKYSDEAFVGHRCIFVGRRSRRATE